MTSSDPITIDREACQRMWEQYSIAHPVAVAAGPEYTTEYFGDSPRLADELLQLVLAGKKTATSSLVAEYVGAGDPLPRIGSHWVVCDGHGAPRAILRTTDLRLGAFDDADDRLAAEEGEDDQTLESWRREHRKYFTRVSAVLGHRWTEQDEIIFERFDLVWTTDTRH